MNTNVKLNRSRVFALRVTTVCSVLFSVSSGVSSVAHADYTINTSLGVESTDNANQSGTEIRETSINAALNATGKTQSTNVDADFGYSLSADRYLKNTFDDRENMEGSGYLVFHNTRRTLSWFFSDIEELALQDRSVADTPDNRVLRSIVSTGPQLSFSVSSVDSVSVGATYSKTHVDVEDSNNNEQVAANVEWAHQISTTASFGLSAFASDVTFDEGGDYESVGYSFNGNLRAPWGSVTVSAGQSEAKPELGDSSDSITYRTNYSAPFPKLKFSVYAVKALTDGVSGISPLQFDIENLASTDSNITNSSIIESQSFGSSIGYPFESINASVSASLSYSEEDFVETEQQDSSQTASISFAKSISTQVSMTIGYSLKQFDSELEGVESESEEQMLSVSSGYKASQDLSFSASISHSRRDDELTEETGKTSVSARVTYRIR